ncbi:MAG: hypothetical protein IPJ62_01005 [Betaproteobacteria bacterium]|nr:hypothetical protein [Betaproteobacteria bacterium]
MAVGTQDDHGELRRRRGQRAGSSSSALSVINAGAPFANLGFEAPPLAGGFQYAPGGVAWVFSGNTGITGNGNAFTSGNPVAPEGCRWRSCSRVAAFRRRRT